MWTLQKEGEAQLGLSGIRKELQWAQQSYTKDSSIVSVPVVPDWRNISVCQGSSEGPHLPDQSLGLHCRQQWHISIPSGHLVLHQQHWEMCSYIYNKLTQQCVLLRDPKPGIATYDPSNGTALLLSAIVKTRSLTCYKPLTLKTLEKPMNCLYRPSPSHIHALDCNECSNSCTGISLWKTLACYFNFTDLIKQNPSL